jgi:hypothetical protein
LLIEDTLLKPSFFRCGPLSALFVVQAGCCNRAT